MKLIKPTLDLRSIVRFISVTQNSHKVLHQRNANLNG